jgi:hypothetical protein
MKIAVIFHNVHMGLSHEGLSVLAKKKGFDPQTLPSDRVLVYINRSHDKLKIMTAGGHILGYLNNRGRRIALEALQYIPQAFGNKTGLDYDKALRLHLTKVLADKANRRSGVGMYRAKTFEPLKPVAALNAALALNAK